MIDASVVSTGFDFSTLLDQTLSEEAQAKQVADFAIQSEATALLVDLAIAGSVVVKRWVDGVFGASEYGVKVPGEIFYEFEFAEDVLKFIADELKKTSPVGSGADKHPGLYKQSHVLFADGIELPSGSIPLPAHEYIFVNPLPYSRKIEAGQSSQAPSGVYEATAFLAQSRFGNVAKIMFFDYIGTFNSKTETHPLRGFNTKLQHNKSENRYPAIKVNL
jgi:hypothetical protein